MEATARNLETLEHETEALPQRAESLRVVCAESYAEGGAILKGVRALRTEVKATFDPIVQTANKAWKEAIAQRKRFLDPLDQAESLLKRQISAYLDAEEAKRREAEAKAAAEAHKADEEARLRRAESLEAAGDAAGAERALEMGMAPAPAPVAEAPKVEGISSRVTYKAEVTDLHALVKAIAEDRSLLWLVQGNVTKINGMARSLGEEMRIPGIRVYAQRSMAVRRDR